ncbi:DHA2 family efflux MFS transporter permease subunit [Microbispora triticiradicis]|uniref:Multidrug efflux MFS transporter n=2 Tax=Microbispora TaxID=2005 RepID=A0ABY3M2L9_9ACTN|nr:MULTISPECIES: DHA2 family efflux MFS transporter permease subunit [Microbispora]TLP57767.1 multidrug efflux MFS transporter [Microbispora fusca]TYB64637.1 multidrug efflux MFS transporter [Microbispora tritici]
MTDAAGATPSRLMSAGLVAGPVLSMIDSSVVNLAVPDLVRELGRPLEVVQWAVSGYLLALAIGLAATSYLARRFGLVPTYAGSLTLFTVSSAACALSADAGMLICFRVVQGLAGAPLIPLAIGLLIGRGGAAEGAGGKVPLAAGLAFFAAPALGVSLGGLLIGAYGWRSIFLVNLPVGLLALPGALAARRAGLGTRGDRAVRPDLPGLVLLAAGLGLTTYGVERAAAHGWATPSWPAGLALLAAYVLWARHRPQAALALDLARDPVRALTLALCAVSSVVLFAVLFLAPLYLQTIQHHSGLVTGLALLPQGLAMGVSAAAGTRMAERFSVRFAVVAGMLFLAVTTGLMALLSAGTPVWLTTLLLCGRGLAIGFTSQPLVVSLLGGLPPVRVPDANTLFSVVQRLAGSFGIALLVTLLTTRGAATGSALTGFRETMLVLAATALLGALGAASLRRPAERSPLVRRPVSAPDGDRGGR